MVVAKGYKSIKLLNYIIQMIKFKLKILIYKLYKKSKLWVIDKYSNNKR